MAKHEIIFEKNMHAKCKCGEWQFIGLLPEAKKAVRAVYQSHLSIHKKKRKK